MPERRALWASTDAPGGISTYVRVMQQTRLWSDWNVRHIVTHRDGSTAAKIAAFARGALRFIVELIRFHPDVVHLHPASNGSFIRKGILLWISRLADVPVIMHIHGSVFQVYYENSSFATRALIRATLCRASAVVALGEARAAELRVIAPDARITSIPNAVRRAERSDQPAHGEPVGVVFLGSIGDRKGTFRLLDAWARLGPIAATLTIAGDGEVDRARRRIQELHLEKTVEVREWLSEADVYSLLHRSQVFVLPSRYEGQSMAVLEAMARGLCVVTSDVGGQPEMIGGGCGILVPPDDIEAIAAALRLVIHDDALRARYGAAAYARVADQFDVRTTSRLIDTLYCEVSGLHLRGVRVNRRRPIRALFVVPDLRVGGAERHLTTLLPRMDPERFSPSVVCIGDEGGLFSALPAAGVDARALHMSGKRNAARALRELLSITRRVRPDVVVVRSYNAETLGRIAARIAGVEHTIVWVHNFGDVEPRSKVHSTVDRSLTRWTSAYFGVAEAQRNYLVNELEYPNDKVRIIHNGVDPARFGTDTDRSPLAEFHFAQGDPVVGILAALRPEKDHATLLRAARIVIEKIPRARFLVIGDGVTRTQLEALCTELGITPNVHFAGTRADVARLLCAIDVFVLTSITVECFPIALLEAMACARPAVCTAVGGIPEMIEHGESGFLVPPKDPRQLATRLVSLLSDPQTARRMGRAGRDRVETEFSLDRSVAAAEQAIEDVVSGRGALSESSNG